MSGQVWLVTDEDGTEYHVMADTADAARVRIEGYVALDDGTPVAVDKVTGPLSEAEMAGLVVLDEETGQRRTLAEHAKLAKPGILCCSDW